MFGKGKVFNVKKYLEVQKSMLKASTMRLVPER
jgi:hypothetical protein